MEEAAKELKKLVKKLGKSFVKVVLPPLLAVIIIVALIAGSAYIIMKRIAKSVAEAASSFTQSVTIDENGVAKAGVTAKEVWDEMISKGYDVKQYLSNPEELAKLMKAEIVTKLPDTRENVEEEIDWEALKNSEDIQGIIKFKRHDSYGNTFYMTYVKPEDFQAQVDEYNSSGSESARDFIEHHFTLKKGSGGGSNGSSVLGGAPGEFKQQGNMETDGYAQTYTASSGLTFIDYKQNRGPWAGQAYNGSTIGSYGCGVTAVAAVLSGLGFNKTPGDTGSDLNGRGTMGGAIPAYMQELGLNAYERSGGSPCVSASEIANVLKEGNVIVARYDAGSAFCSTSEHFVSIVDYNESKNEFLVLNSCDLVPPEASRWFTASEVETGIHQMTAIDANAAIQKAKGSNSNSSKSSNSSKNDSSTNKTQTTTIGEQVVKYVKSKVGHPYVWATHGPDTFDCSGLTSAAYASAGVEISTSDAGQYDDPQFEHVAVSQAQPGDILWKSGHVGIYIGNNEFIHASNPTRGVVQESLSSTYGYWVEALHYKNAGGSSSTTTSTTSTTTPNNYTGQIDAGKSGDGYPGTYTSSTGFEYKDFKQGQGQYATQRYWCGTVTTCGCGPSSVAILASGLKPDLNYTPGDTSKIVTDKFGDISNAGTMKQLMDDIGLESEIIYDPSAEEIQNQLKSGKVMVVSTCRPPSIFPNGSGHYIAATDINESGQVYIMNPNAKQGADTGWYDATTVASGCNAIIVTDSGKVGVASSNPSSTNSSAGYIAVVGTWNQVNNSTESGGDGVARASHDLNVPIENNTTYTVSTTEINYEPMVQPYTLSFDLLWSFLTIGQSKGFIMDLADLAYESEIEISVYDSLTTQTTVDMWSYADITSAQIEGKLSYTDKANKINVEKDITHEHLLKDGEQISRDDGYITKTVVRQNNKLQAKLSKLDTWIARYSNEYVSNYKEGNEEINEENYDIQQVTAWTLQTHDKDPCDIIPEKKKELIKEVNDKYKEINKQNNFERSKAVDKDQATKDINTKPIEITEDDIDISKAKVRTKVDRAEIKDKTSNKIDTQEYTELTPYFEIKDEITTKKATNNTKKKEEKKEENKQNSQTEQNTEQKQVVQNLDNFLFIGDSRYDGEETITNLGNNTKNVGVGSARIDEWRDVAQNGGKGSVQGRAVDITGNYSGISIQLGANSIGYGVDTAVNQMKDFLNALKKIHPNTPIIVNSCLPDTDYSQSEIQGFNNGVKNYCNTINNMYYVDVSTNLVDSNGYLKGEYTQDGCHLSSSEAIQIFANNIKNGALGKASTGTVIPTESAREMPEDYFKMEENFVSLFNKYKYRDNKNNILSGAEWLFEIIKVNDKIANQLDIVKYLLYKATGTDYGVTELEENLFNPENFNNVQSQTSGGTVGQDLISFTEAMEGEGEKSGDDYVVYYTSFDGCLNVGAGVVVKFGDGSTRFTEIIGEPYVGQIVSKENYIKMFNQEFKEITDVLDAELAAQGVTLKSYQRDAMISCLYNVGVGYAKRIVTAYKTGGNDGYWNETKNYVHSVTGEYLLGLQRRREQEYKLFTEGVYDWPY